MSGSYLHQQQISNLEVKFSAENYSIQVSSRNYTAKITEQVDNEFLNAKQEATVRIPVLLYQIVESLDV